MSTLHTPAPTAGLSLERFREIYEGVRDRHDNPAALAELLQDPEVQTAWTAYAHAVDRDVRDINNNLRHCTSEDAEKKVFARSFRGRWSRLERKDPANPYRSAPPATLTPEFAFVLADLDALASMPDEQWRTARLGEMELEPNVRNLLGDASHLQSTYPLYAVACDVLLRHPRPKLKPGDAGVPYETLIAAVRNLQVIQERSGSKTNRLVRNNLGGSTVGTLGKALADERFLELVSMPECFEAAYEGHWHTSPKTKSATGGFTYELRDRLVRESRRDLSEEGRDMVKRLLITNAASSDGRNRSIAGISPMTPESVYDKLVYDNALGVLFHVVESPHFTQYKAAAMIDTGLARQIVAVMLNSHARTPTGRIDLQIRYTACERAIAHEGVDPLYVYQFLHRHSGHDDFPTYLWSDFVKELARRYQVVQLHGDPATQKNFKGRLERFAKVFLEEEMGPYLQAYRKVQNGEAPAAGRWARLAANEGREYLARHEHVKDPALWGILVEGVPEGEGLIELLRHSREAGVPLSKELMVKIFTSSDARVREAGLAMLPNIRPEDIERAQAEIDARVAEDRQRLAHKVYKLVIPDYEPIDGEPRRLSRMRHFFLASKELEAEDLRRIFIRCAEEDPRAIPERFREYTEMRRLAKRMEGQVEAASAVPDETEAEKYFAQPFIQGDLLGGLAPAALSGSVVQSPKRARSQSR